MLNTENICYQHNRSVNHIFINKIETLDPRLRPSLEPFLGALIEAYWNPFVIREKLEYIHVNLHAKHFDIAPKKDLKECCLPIGLS